MKIQKIFLFSSLFTITVAEMAEQWLSAIALKVKISTLVEYEMMVKLHILPSLGQLPIKKLTTARISEFAHDKLQNGRSDGTGGLSPKTVRDILSILKSIIDFTTNEKQIEHHITIIYPKYQIKNMRVLSNSEHSVLKEELLTDANIRKIGILLCLYTGLRVGEVCALRWQDFSPEFDKLTICQSMRRVKNDSGDAKTKIIIDSPKSKSSLRDIPIPKFMSPLLKRFIRKGGIYFLSTPNSQYTEPRTIQYFFKRIITKVGIADANFHSLRHTFSTRCIEAGVDIKSLSQMLGHANVNITLNRYVHSSFDQKREGMNKLEEYLNS